MNRSPFAAVEPEPFGANPIGMFAKRLGISRSELYATALAEFLSRRRSKQVTTRLDSIYDEVDSTLDHEIIGLQSRSLPHEKW